MWIKIFSRWPWTVSCGSKSANPLCLRAILVTSSHGRDRKRRRGCWRRLLTQPEPGECRTTLTGTAAVDGESKRLRIRKRFDPSSCIPQFQQPDRHEPVPDPNFKSSMPTKNRWLAGVKFFCIYETRKITPTVQTKPPTGPILNYFVERQKNYNYFPPLMVNRKFYLVPESLLSDTQSWWRYLKLQPNYCKWKIFGMAVLTLTSKKLIATFGADGEHPY